MNNRGRFQAQGQNLEESTSWAQVLPLLVKDGHGLLDKLESKIPKKEVLIRVDGFEKCRKFIDDAGENGGIQVFDLGRPLKKSFPKGYRERVDVEVHSGSAFVKEIKNE